MTTPNLSFGNYSSATTNGNQMGSLGFAMGEQIQAPTMGASGASAMPNVTVDSPTVPGGATNPAQTGGSGNFWSQNGGAGLILGGVQVLGNLWNSYQAHKMAKEQMSFAREQWNTNLANQTQTYNTALEDRIRARHAYSGQGEGDTQAYLDEHSL
ncbi:virion protein [Roseobacter phage RD-1410Ws-07]|uniref:Virion protein n=2 Tax=Sanyabayvirus DS1410Ws06 TaxID=2844087 RepID=A0A191VYS3_9CAUD|nr:virion protein [Dinoroseobacter phage DS-1410Ws-06]ANJ20716.1 virion protein [Dinoroseobacter phage DS-1410Ws-06]ANJ20867.1 virion protein [Roseobacter phage RD-1410Ws-07]